MDTKVVKIDRNNLKAEELADAAKIIQDGGLVAFPTETVYGLGCDAFCEDAVDKVYEAKGRPGDNPLIIHIAKIEDLGRAASAVPLRAYLLAEKFWPGPLTMILNKHAAVPYKTTGGLETTAVRMPSNTIARTLILESGRLIAAPSANSSGRPSPTKAEHVYDDLLGRIDMILDGGSSDIGLESTIVDLTSKETVILRPGFITKEQIEQVIGSTYYDPAVTGREACIQKPKSPGMKYKHYAPQAELVIFEGSIGNVISKINEIAGRREEEGFKVGIMATDETIGQYHKGIIKSIGTKADEITITSRLYSLLREFDAIGVSYIYSESFDDMMLGHAVMNRLIRASGYSIETV